MSVPFTKGSRSGRDDADTHTIFLTAPSKIRRCCSLQLCDVSVKSDRAVTNQTWLTALRELASGHPSNVAFNCSRIAHFDLLKKKCSVTPPTFQFVGLQVSQCSRL